jgi:short-subunit dehydrogenase
VPVNVEAIVALTGGLLPALLARGHGGIINVASQVAFQPMP